MTQLNNSLSLETNGLILKASLVAWDTEIFQYPVAQIEHIKILNPDKIKSDYAAFESWRNINQCKLISCRLDHAQLNESIFLEEKGFRFIETVLHPKLERLSQLNISDQGLKIYPANEKDLPSLKSIAESAFRHERFHIDPRINPRIGDLRYGRWVMTSFMHPRQRLLKILDNDILIALFIIEVIDNGCIYWHLTAVSPQQQGKGYGRRTWLSMLEYHRSNGHHTVMTTISARNTRILNLYSSLNFRFLPPEMTFHWIHGE